MRVLAIIAALWGLADCRGDETVAAYGGAATDWLLREIDGTAFPARATLSLAEAGKVSGEAPCNRYFGAQTAPYPWFRVEQVAVTRRACPALDHEAQFLEALSEMTLSEVVGKTLILSNDAGREMVFEAME